MIMVYGLIVGCNITNSLGSVNLALHVRCWLFVNLGFKTVSLAELSGNNITNLITAVWRWTSKEKLFYWIEFQCCFIIVNLQNLVWWIPDKHFSSFQAELVLSKFLFNLKRLANFLRDFTNRKICCSLFKVNHTP